MLKDRTILTSLTKPTVMCTGSSPRQNRIVCINLGLESQTVNELYTIYKLT